MRFNLVRAALAASALFFISCSGNDITGPGSSSSASVPSTVRTDVVAAALPTVRISEFHYDNAGTDAGEAIEISMPAATDPAQYSIVLYNGAGGAVYDTDALPSTSEACTTDGTRKVVVLTYPANGIQNGSPDGIALVGPGGTLVEFLSYEGTFTGVGGPANGVLSTDIGVSENGSEALGLSLRRNGADVWSAPGASSFGVCNDEDLPPAVVDEVIITPDGGTVIEGNALQLTATAYDAGDAEIPGTTFVWSSSDETIATVSATGLVTGVNAGSATVTATSPNGKFDEVTIQVEEPPPPGEGDAFISELHYDNDGLDVNERVEIEGPAGGSLEGWSVVLYNLTGGASYATIALSGTFPASCDTRGVLTFNGPANGIQNGPSDGLALVDPSGTVIEFISYEGTLTATDGPANGMTSTDIGVSEPGNASATRSLQRYEDDWYGPSPSSFDACNGPPPPPPPPSISFTGRHFADDPPLPVGFQDQLFATLRDENGAVVPAEFDWSSDTPGIATIDADGVMTAVSAGQAVFRATVRNSTVTNTYSLPMVVATFSGVAYPGNAEFGEPSDGSPADDFIVRHSQFTLSYSSIRNTPNWVSYNLDASHIGSQDRCDCFTYDPALPATYTRYTTADYTGAGAFHGYGIDRGHLARSFDRTTGNLDNAYTFYFSNIVPQANALNTGPWANMENFLGNLATAQNKEVYIVTGVAGNKGTIKNEGIITIPEFTWKVAVILPRDQGLSSIDDLGDLEVIAAILPNTPDVGSDWNAYRTTVDAVEALSGYDLLALLPDPIEIAVESQTVPPVAAVDGPYAALEFESIAMSAAGSSDADAGQALTYNWDFGDGSAGTGESVSHSYSTGGNYTIRVIVSDPLGLADTVFTTAAIQTPTEAAGDALDIIAQLLADGKISSGNANALSSKVDNAIKSLAKENDGAAVNQLNALLNQLADMVSTGVLSAEDAEPLRALIVRVVASASQ